jgi:hypothetical protein
MREPRAEGAPSRRGVAPSAGLLSALEEGCRAGVSRTSLRNCELFIVVLVRNVVALRCEMSVSMSMVALSLVLPGL